MRTILRVGIIIGGLAFITLYALQPVLALAATPGVVLAGLCAGLGTAKWLDRSWYGRQFTAGLRAGTIAVGLAGAGVLLSALTQGPRSIDQLASQSRLFSLNGAPVVHSLAFAGWVGVDVLLVLLAMLVGITISAFIVQIFAWSKNRHAIQVVTKARLAAQASLRGESWASPSGSGTMAAISGGPASGLTGQHLVLGLPAIAPTSGQHPIQPLRSMQGITPGMMLPDVPPIANAQTPRTGVQQPQQPQQAPWSNYRPASEPEEFQPTEPALPSVQPQPGTMGKRVDARKPSHARSKDSQLTETMREALATWAADNAENGQDSGAEGTPTPKSRTPAPSAYLNSTPSAPPVRRARKKTNTEWLC